MSLIHKAISGVKWSSLSTGVVTVLQLSTLIILARLLSPSDFGLMGMIMVVIGFAQLFADMGISNAIIYHQDATREELSSLYWLNILAGIVIFLIICGVSPLISLFYHEPRLNNLLYLSALIFLITPFGQLFQILLQKKLKFYKLAKIEILAAFANTITSITLAILGEGVFSLIWGQLTGALVRILLLICFCRKLWHPQLHFRTKSIKKYLSFGLYQMGEKAINYLKSNVDYLLIGSILGPQALGYYSLAYQLIIKPVSTINPIINRVAFPIFSLLQNDSKRLKRGYLKALQLLSTLNFPVLTGIAITAPIVVPIIFGNDWLPSIILIQILSIVGLLRSIGNPVGSLLLAKGRADLGFKWNLVLTIIQIPVLYIGAKFGGAIGVATVFATLQCFYATLNYLVLIRLLLGPCLREYLTSIWPSLWMSLVMAIVVFSLGIAFQELPALLLLFLQVLSGVAIYIGLIFYKQKQFVVELKILLKTRGSEVVSE